MSGIIISISSRNRTSVAVSLTFKYGHGQPHVVCFEIPSQVAVGSNDSSAGTRDLHGRSITLDQHSSPVESLPLPNTCARQVDI